jgi:hypothetical protein
VFPNSAFIWALKREFSVPLLVDALPEYEIVPSHSNAGDVVLIRKLNFSSEEEFAQECRRVAAKITVLTRSKHTLTCMYDESSGVTRYWRMDK